MSNRLVIKIVVDASATDPLRWVSEISIAIDAKLPIVSLAQRPKGWRIGARVDQLAAAFLRLADPDLKQGQLGGTRYSSPADQKLAHNVADKLRDPGRGESSRKCLYIDEVLGEDFGRFIDYSRGKCARDSYVRLTKAYRNAYTLTFFTLEGETIAPDDVYRQLRQWDKYGSLGTPSRAASGAGDPPRQHVAMPRFDRRVEMRGTRVYVAFDEGCGLGPALATALSSQFQLRTSEEERGREYALPQASPNVVADRIRARIEEHDFVLLVRRGRAPAQMTALESVVQTITRSKLYLTGRVGIVSDDASHGKQPYPYAHCFSAAGPIDRLAADVGDRIRAVVADHYGLRRIAGDYWVLPPVAKVVDAIVDLRADSLLPPSLLPLRSWLPKDTTDMLRLALGGLRPTDKQAALGNLGLCYARHADGDSRQLRAICAYFISSVDGADARRMTSFLAQNSPEPSDGVLYRTVQIGQARLAKNDFWINEYVHRLAFDEPFRRQQAPVNVGFYAFYNGSVGESVRKLRTKLRQPTVQLIDAATLLSMSRSPQDVAVVKQRVPQFVQEGMDRGLVDKLLEVPPLLPA